MRDGEGHRLSVSSRGSLSYNIIIGSLLLALATPLRGAEPLPPFTRNAVIVFQGDEVTLGRNKSGMIGSYAFIVAATIGSQAPERNLRFFNHGVIGDKVGDLEARWRKDTLDSKPDILSILIGMNDAEGGVTPQQFEQQYDQLLAATVKALPNVKLVICEPFRLPLNDTVRSCQEAAKRLASKYHAPLVRLQDALEEAEKRINSFRDGKYRICDTVHPSCSAHRVIADEWIRTVEAFYGTGKVAPALGVPAMAEEPMPLFARNAGILFQGDSISNGGHGSGPNHDMMGSYAFLISSKYEILMPERNLIFRNSGVMGNKVSHLAGRWQIHTINLKPDVLSILVGINDANGHITPRQYEEQYDQLLAKTVKALPNVKLVICEPFRLPLNDTVKSFQEIAKRLAEKYHAPLVRLQHVFDDAEKRANPRGDGKYWIWDTVHPTYAGQQLIADEWIRTVAAFYGPGKPAECRQKSDAPDKAP